MQLFHSNCLLLQLSRFVMGLQVCQFKGFNVILSEGIMPLRNRGTAPFSTKPSARQTAHILTVRTKRTSSSQSPGLDSPFVQPHNTYHPRSLQASGMSGFTMTVLEDSTERLRPPKSETRAPLIAITGCLEPSNLSACITTKIPNTNKSHWQEEHTEHFYRKQGKRSIAE